jgi:uncharacterized coiled-coil protein SlyX
MAGVSAVVVAMINGIATASSTSEGIVALSPAHTLTSGASVAGGKTVAYVVSGGSTTVPTDATRVQLLVTVSNQAKVGSLTAQPYLDAADASGDSVSWPAIKTTETATFLEPVGVSNKVSFTNNSAGTVTVAIKITGYATSARLAQRLDTVESKQATDESAIGDLQAQLNTAQQTISTLSGQLGSAQQTISSLSSQLSADESVLQSMPRVTASTRPGLAGEYVVVMTGANLLPGTGVVGHYLLNGNPTTAVLASVAADGSLNFATTAFCQVTNLYLTSADMAGNSLASNRISKGPGCP